MVFTQEAGEADLLPPKEYVLSLKVMLATLNLALHHFRDRGENRWTGSMLVVY